MSHVLKIKLAKIRAFIICFRRTTHIYIYIDSKKQELRLFHDEAMLETERKSTWVSALEHGGCLRNLRNQTENETKP